MLVLLLNSQLVILHLQVYVLGRMKPAKIRFAKIFQVLLIHSAMVYLKVALQMELIV